MWGGWGQDVRRQRTRCKEAEVKMLGGWGQDVRRQRTRCKEAEVKMLGGWGQDVRRQRTRCKEAEDKILGGWGQDVRRLRTWCEEAEDKIWGSWGQDVRRLRTRCENPKDNIWYFRPDVRSLRTKYEETEDINKEAEDTIFGGWRHYMRRLKTLYEDAGAVPCGQPRQGTCPHPTTCSQTFYRINNTHFSVNVTSLHRILKKVHANTEYAARVKNSHNLLNTCTIYIRCMITLSSFETLCMIGNWFLLEFSQSFIIVYYCTRYVLVMYVIINIFKIVIIRNRVW